MKKPLRKWTIIIWQPADETDFIELEDLAQESQSGSCYCSSQKSEIIENPSEDSDWDGTEFFGEDK